MFTDLYVMRTDVVGHEEGVNCLVNGRPFLCHIQAMYMTVMQLNSFAVERYTCGVCNMILWPKLVIPGRVLNVPEISSYKSTIQIKPKPKLEY